MTAVPTRTKKPALCAHPRGGRAKLVREAGVSQDHGAVFDAWARGMGDGQLWKCLPGWDLIQPKDIDVSTFTTFFHVTATLNVVAAWRRCGWQNILLDVSLSSFLTRLVSLRFSISQ